MSKAVVTEPPAAKLVMTMRAISAPGTGLGGASAVIGRQVESIPGEFLR